MGLIHEIKSAIKTRDTATLSNYMLSYILDFYFRSIAVYIFQSIYCVFFYLQMDRPYPVVFFVHWNIAAYLP